MFHALTLKSNGEFALIIFDLVILPLVFKMEVEYTLVPLTGLEQCPNGALTVSIEV